MLQWLQRTGSIDYFDVYDVCFGFEVNILSISVAGM